MKNSHMPYHTSSSTLLNMLYKLDVIDNSQLMEASHIHVSYLFLKHEIATSNPRNFTMITKV